MAGEHALSADAAPSLHPAYRPDIDGLRAVAVGSVVIFHAFPEWFAGGFIGVDIFFVISGFLISLILFKNLEHGRFSIVDFYVRRVRRIFPALMTVMSLCLVAGWFVLFADEYKQLGKHPFGGSTLFPISCSGARAATSTTLPRPSRCCTSGAWPSRNSSTCSGHCCWPSSGSAAGASWASWA